MAKHLLRHPRIRIGVLAEREHLLLTEEAVATGNRKGYDHAIAYCQIVNFSTYLDHFTHEFMAEYVASLHRRNESVIHMQVGTADCRGGDFYDRISLVKDLRIWNFLDNHRCLAVPTVG